MHAAEPRAASGGGVRTTSLLVASLHNMLHSLTDFRTKERLLSVYALRELSSTFHFDSNSHFCPK